MSSPALENNDNNGVDGPALELLSRLEPVSGTGPLYGCIHVPEPSVQALVRNDPHLRRKPLAVLDGVFPLLTVTAANALARQAGVRPGMTPVQLEPLPQVQTRPRSLKQEESLHGALLDGAFYFTPRVEDTAPDAITLDLSGLARLWGDPPTIAQRLLHAANRLGVDVHVALASNPDTAVHAARACPGITVIPPGEERQKLASAPIQLLPANGEIQETFTRWGLGTFGDLARLPEIQISERLGQEGVHLHRIARGEAARPLLHFHETPGFEESLELEDAIDSLEPLQFILSRLLNQICQRLTARNQTTNELKIHLTLQNSKSENKNFDFERTIQIPLPIRDAKILLKLLHLDLEANRPPAPVTAVTLSAAPVEHRTLQTGLFQPQTPEPEKLQVTLSKIRSIVGEENVGTPDPIDTHRPDAFLMKSFNIPLGPASRKTLDRERIQVAERSRAPQRLHRMDRGVQAGASTAMKIFRPPQPATVELDQDRPVRLLFAGKTGKVLSAAGPWRTSGDWWREDAWAREEWDVEIQTGWNRTLYRIHRDPRRDCWFINGIYD